jgi:3'-phosphoadenosine 5'-phosphosulfate sulfotransferase (PAPS reductase)/FAD synthetase
MKGIGIYCNMRKEMTNKHLLKWKLYARTWTFKKKVKQSINFIKKALKMDKKWAVSWSGGKDSTVLSHLVKSIESKVEIISQIDDCDWPEKRSYIERVSKKEGWNVHIAVPEFSVHERIFEEDLVSVDICDLSHNITKYGFIKPLQDMQSKLNIEGIFLGLRESESKVRKMNFKKRGMLYNHSDGIYRCLPLQHWKAIDCFAYLVSNDIEINPCYFYNRFLSPEEIRLCWAVPTFSTSGNGKVDITEEHFRYYNPKQYELLKEKRICH